MKAPPEHNTMADPPAVTLDRPRLSLTEDGKAALKRRNEREAARQQRIREKRKKERREQIMREGLEAEMS